MAAAGEEVLLMDLLGLMSALLVLVGLPVVAAVAVVPLDLRLEGLVVMGSQEVLVLIQVWVVALVQAVVVTRLLIMGHTEEVEAAKE